MYYNIDVLYSEYIYRTFSVLFETFDEENDSCGCWRLCSSILEMMSMFLEYGVNVENVDVMGNDNFMYVCT